MTGINTVRVEWTKSSEGKWTMKEVPGTEEYFKADLVLLSMVKEKKKMIIIYNNILTHHLGLFGTYKRINRSTWIKTR